ncbi:SDR family oxidoreductase [Spongiibacter sp. KMU-158]|uniref:SDR family oxidoreductase n=1 Tax=Spongiibacter pelagi TaxID=2760804 RepID=A0A927C1A7_9GAMM|nr:SDR family oxidoreductase [Spongiibacter pelagi]MBD2858353.1 SDR family oxidoreductase [Spongiibacter pelagi]
MKPLTIVLTGATGGIGQAIAKELAAAGHRLVLLGRNAHSLANLQQQLPGNHSCFTVDLSDEAQLQSCCEKLTALPLDALINNAGLSWFGDIQQDADSLEQLMAVNLIAPIRLTQNLLPTLLKSSEARIINIGSSFGSIGYPGFSLYCASKFGLRGFTESLQRELADQAIAIHYLAPRAVNTEMNSPAVNALNKELGNQVDEPSIVAHAVLKLIEKSQSQHHFLGWPERFFVKLNALFPSVVGKALSKQLPIIRRHFALNK